MFLQTSSFSFHSRAVPIISIAVFAGMLTLQKLEMAETSFGHLIYQCLLILGCC